jgi:phenylacetate-CoA ligase
MYDREIFYLKLPILLQHATCSIEGWRIQRSRFGNRFQKLLQEAEERTFWTAEQVTAYRDERLRAFVRHCYHMVPFYRRRFQELGLVPDDIQTLEDLQKLPVLTKEEVQNNYPDLVSQAVPPKKQIITHTSGTTGGGLRFSTTLQSIQEQWAIWWRYRRWHGLQPGTWCGYFGGRSVAPLSQTRPPFWRYNFPGKQILFSAHHMSHDNLDAYIGELFRRQPLWLHGYPSLLALVAGHVLERGMDLDYRVRWITIGAENLLPQQIELIQQAFGVHPKQHYGIAEAVANISECDHGQLHVDEDFAAVEFIPNPHGPGYKVIGTNLTNPATPLLRYDVQDLVTLAEATCPCGRPGRIVASVDGRAEDYIVLRNGARLGRLDHIFKDLVNIREAQIYQKYPGEIIIRVVRGDGYSETDEVALLKETQKRLGSDTEICIDYVESLERSRTGKLRFVISEIPEGQLENIKS